MRIFFLRVWKVGRWILLALVVLFIGLVIYRIPFIAEQERTEEAITRIKAQILSIEDVTGERLPPKPDPALVDATVEGIDANRNGIRDDVELAIFERYPGDINIKIRAAMLQYAMGLQLYLTDVFNSDVWKVAVTQDSRGYFCILKFYPRDENNLDLYFQIVDEKQTEVKDLVFNTKERKDKELIVDSFATSFSLPTENFCDVQID